MESGVKEVFDENGKELSELLQEWINENKSYIYNECQKKLIGREKE